MENRQSTPTSVDELARLLSDLVEQQHNYETSAEALRDGTLACFNLLASKLGNTGFQASWAILNVLGQVNGYDGPFAILKADTMLFPQYGTLPEQAAELEAKWGEWAAEQAEKKLAEDPDMVHPDVLARWKELAA